MGILLCEQNVRHVWIRNKSVRAEIGQILHTHTHTTAAKLVVRMCGVSVLSLMVIFSIVIIDVCRVTHNMYAIICQVYGGLLVGCDVLVHVSDVLSRVSDVISLVYLIICLVRGVVSRVMRLCLLP